MNTMQYKGYLARIEFDDRDDIFVGRILGVKSIVSFHAETVAMLRQSMRDAVDAYLADCAARGMTPEKTASGNLMLRISSETHAAIGVAASVTGTSINQWSEDVLGRAAREVLERATHA